MPKMTPAERKMKIEREHLSALIAYLIGKPLTPAEQGYVTNGTVALNNAGTSIAAVKKAVRDIAPITGDFYRGEAAQLSPAIIAQVKNPDDLVFSYLRNEGDIEFEGASAAEARVRGLYAYAKKHGLTIPAVEVRRVARKPYPANRYAKAF